MGVEVPAGWTRCRLGDVINLKRGYDLPERKRRPGSVPIVSSSGPSGLHDEAKVRAPGVVTGRYGTIGHVFKIAQDFWPLNTALYVEDFKGNDPSFIAVLLQTINWRAHDGKSGVPGINRNHVHEELVAKPPLREQQAIATVLASIDDKIVSNRRLGSLGGDAIASQFSHVVSGTAGRCSLCEVASEVRTRFLPLAAPNRVFEQFSIPAFDEARGPEVCAGSDMASAKTLMPDGPIVLFSKLNPVTKRVWWPERLGIGTPVCSPEFVALVPRDPDDAVWLYGCAAFDTTFYEQVLAAVTGTTGSRQRVRPEHVLSSTVPAASEEVRRVWESVARPVIDTRVTLVRESRTLTAIRDALLPKLISGRIRVPLSNDPEEQVGAAVEALA